MQIVEAGMFKIRHGICEVIEGREKLSRKKEKEI